MPLPWFRRQKGKAEDAPIEAAVPTAEPELELAPVAESAADGLQPTTPRKRRRGSRGGRGRKKSPATAAAGAESVAKPAAERSSAPAEKADAEPKQSERKGRAARSPRRTAPRRAPLPKAKRELLISVDPGEKRVAVLEDGVVAEVYLERPEHRSIAGNIYLGTVDNVLPGMEAAFVEIGLEKNGFLYVDEIVGPELEGRKGARKIQDLIQRGQTVLVQAVKDPMKTKGARLTTEISLPGRFVVFVPHGDGLGVSRRLDDDERNRLKAIVKGIAPKTGGVIVRTAAEGASAEDVARDLDFLMRLWSTIEASAKKAKSPALIYQEAELPLRVTRDLFTGDFERLLVDHDRTHKRIVGYLKKTSPHMVERVTRYKEREPLLEAFGVEQEIKSTLSRRVDLPSGGYLIFDYAEAFTVIDVNTGRFVGSRSKRNGPGRLEDTITKNNLEAVKEVVRQLRLRDVGGIIVIDFIDMANPKNRQQVEDALRQELERDRTKTYVVEISPLGLVEMTRQNVTDGPREVMTRKCPTCDGDGIIVSESTAAVEVERRIRGLVTPGSRAKAFKVELNAKVAELLVGLDGSRIQELEEVTKRRFFFVGVENVHLDHMRVIDQGTVEKLAPSAPVEPGQELELKLGEVGLHDPRAGAGKVKGFEVVVAGAAKLVGKRVQRADHRRAGGCRVRRPDHRPGGGNRADHGRGRGGEADARQAAVEGDCDADADADADAEVDEDADVDVDVDAERSRGRGARRGRDPHAAGAAQAGSVQVGRLEIAAQACAADGDDVEAGASEEPPAPKRPRTRKPAVAAATEAAETAEAVDDGAEPDAEGADGETPAPAKKRTRRGTRGGRNRKRKPTAATNGDGEAEATSPTIRKRRPRQAPRRPRHPSSTFPSAISAATATAPKARTTQPGARAAHRSVRPAAGHAGAATGASPRAPQPKPRLPPRPQRRSLRPPSPRASGRTRQ